ncbi:MAG: 1-deoxy-D-xylulose-5-phosphate synthase [Clostridiales bacterium]|nr:1-deoxy-D-xylulose-5-phosphate synthase [Clostridiales bacterium]
MGRVLDRINCPADLKQLSKKETELLCKEIRQCIINTVKQNGGHMASNLGTVELTIAIHKVFDAPEDKIIFDVGHQCYTHKILTGRKDAFSTLRQKGGISGFPNIFESDYDAFGAGHSSTSISAAVGMARARDLMGQRNSVVAVIGDGALTGGMSYEALNDGADLNSSLIVILNDNEMSISKNVGGMTTYLNEIRSSPRYHRFKKRFKGFLKRIPLIGAPLYRMMDWFKDCIKRIFLKQVFFEEIGYTYIGPVDGHNIEDMTAVLSQAKELNKPVFIHMVTKKGLGYQPAVDDPEKFHGVSPFVVEHNGDGGESCSSIFGRVLTDLTHADDRVVAITAAMPSGTGLNGYRANYPHRFYDVGITEEHAVTMAAGMARCGMRPYFAVYSTFLQRAYDQLLSDVCLQKLPVTICIDRTGIVGEDGETHQGLFDLPMLLPMPGMTVMMPSAPYEMEQMLRLTLTHDGPMAIRYPKGALWNAPVKEDVVCGKSQILLPVEELTVVTAGRMIKEAYEAISTMGGGIGLVNLRFIKPVDEEMIRQLKAKAKTVLVIEEGTTVGGIGDAVASCLMDAREIRVVKMGVEDHFVRHGKTKDVLHDLGLDKAGIANKLHELLEDMK